MLDELGACPEAAAMMTASKTASKHPARTKVEQVIELFVGHLPIVGD